MASAIAESLQSVTNCNASIINYSQTTADWQSKIEQTGLTNADATYLVIPNDVETLAVIVKQAAGEKWSLIPCGNGSKLAWGGLAKEVQLVVSTQKCDRIIEHAIEDLTITVEAGITLAQLQAKLKASNQFLPIDPAFPNDATIGGILATADTGSWRQRYGGIRDLVLGISFIRGDGEIAKAGGRVVKNVAGYDLMKLFIGSYGTLGIITEVTFRTYPLPVASQTIAISGEATAIAKAIELIKNSGLTPTAADLLTASVAKKLDMEEKLTLLIRLQTIPESITAQTDQLNTMVKDLGVKVSTYTEQKEDQLWQQLSELNATKLNPETVICKLGIIPTEAVTFLEKVIASDSDNEAVIHIGSGVGRLKLTNSNLELVRDLRTFCQQHFGFLTILDAPSEVKQKIDVWGYNGNALTMMQTIKNKFDPNNIFNRDRFLV